jgi:hypothetical protein
MSNSSVAPPLDIALEIGKAVEDVQAVFLALAEKEKRLTVLTIVPERKRSVLRQVYAVEQQIINRNQDFDFAFSVLASHGREPREVVQDPDMYLAFTR